MFYVIDSLIKRVMDCQEYLSKRVFNILDLIFYLYISNKRLPYDFRFSGLKTHLL